MKTRETTEQQIICQWLTWNQISFMSIPNGAVIGGRNKWALIQKLKNEGMLPGAPDLILIERSPEGYQVAIEMKRKGGKLSDDQVDVIRRMRIAGWIVIVAEGADDAIVQLKQIGF